MIIPVILSGGAGTRLWPLSRAEKPKQFLPLVSSRTLFQDTVLRLNGIPGLAAPIVVCNEAHRFLAAEQLREVGVEPAAILLESAGRNTAPAIAIAASVALQRAESGPEVSDSDPILLVLPADHVIKDATALQRAVVTAVAAADNGSLVTFGIVPTGPETGYGYIEQGDPDENWFRVRRFVEKPDLPTARSYLDSGGFLWNSGMFLFHARAFLDELEQHAPLIHAACVAAAADASSDGDFTRLGDQFLESPSDSIDYAVMEHTDRAAVVPLDAGWSDVGSWSALHESLAKDEAGNVFRGRVTALNSAGNLVLSSKRTVALLGIDNAVIVESDDVLLIAAMDMSQEVKQLQLKLKDDD